MALRIVLAGVLVVGAALCGKALSDAARRRAIALRALLEDVRLLRISMVSMFEPVADSLARASSPLLRQVGEGMSGGTSARDAWKSVQRGRAASEAALVESDCRLLDALFEKLGESGRERQDAMLGGMAERLERQAAAAEEKARGAERLYVTLGTLTGLLLALMVL